jgi:hypothetical protein
MQRAQRVGQVRAIHVRHEVHARTLMRVRLQCFDCHRRAEVGSADADVHDIGDANAGVPGPVALTDRVREGADVLQCGADLRHDVFAIDRHRPVRSVAQRNVQHRASFGGVDRLAGKHAIAQCLHAGAAGQREQRGH